MKEPKFYFYDHTYAEDNEGARLEHLVACALLKELHYLEDTQGIKTNLHFLRTKDGKEIDFLICLEGIPTLMLEVKQSDSQPAKGFDHFSKHFNTIKMCQVVKKCEREKTYPNGLAIRALIPWLSALNFTQNE